MYFNNSQKGGITVFQCIILTALLLFFGVMVDLARIMLAEKEINSAVNTAARSVLAGYDKDLVGDYGLFALDTVSGRNKIKSEFVKYLSVNLQTERKGFCLIGYEIDIQGTSVKGYGNMLGNDNNVFKEQILKYMKYRAPLNTTRNIVDKLTASGIFKKKDFAVKEREVRTHSREIKFNVKKINSSIKNANTALTDITQSTINEANGREYINKLRLLETSFSQSDNAITEAMKGLSSYEKASKESAAVADIANNEDNLKGEAGIRIHKKEFDNAGEELNKVKLTLDNRLANIRMQLSIIEPLQSEIENIAAQISSLIIINSNLQKEIKPIRITDLKEKILLKVIMENNKKVIEQIAENKRKISALQEVIKSKLQQMNTVKIGMKTEKIKEMVVSEAQNIPEEAPKPVNGDSKKALSELQKNLDKLLGNRHIDSTWLISNQEYINTEVEDGIKYTELNNKSIPASEEDVGRAEEANNNIFAFMDKVKAALENSAKNIYIVEYIMDRFTYHTTLTDRDHYFQKGEVEYILWGNRSQKVNIASNITAMGFLRFAINSIDYFATSKVPHPVYRLVYAVGKGLLQATSDCFDLYKGENVALCPTLDKSEFKLNYADHLRIFLLIQAAADGEGQLNNIRQLVQVNIKKPDTDFKLQRADFKLSNYNTVLEAKTAVKVNLWFLPILQVDKLGLKRFEGGKFVLHKEICLGY